jgi:hypothetical protein
MLPCAGEQETDSHFKQLWTQATDQLASITQKIKVWIFLAFAFSKPKKTQKEMQV